MVRVRLVAMGNIVLELNLHQITHWKSKLFSIEKEVKRGILPQKGDWVSWAYSDELLTKSFSKINHTSQADIVFYIIDAPIQNNYLSRVLTNNRIVITFYEAKQLLQEENIPLENYIISHIYSYVLLYLTKSNKELTFEDEMKILHDYRENCLYDMCGIKSEVIYKCVQPIICEQCKAYLISNGVSKDDVNNAEKELNKLKRNLYYRIVHFLKKHLYMAFLLSCCLALGLNILANFIFNYLSSHN